ncbi:hypothetical protein F4604DRAFT_1715218 [Suillus subluteus]|nr:hypothetical protein F4604DRAFT_1715218 [Suillus subluteus]
MSLLHIPLSPFSLIFIVRPKSLLTFLSRHIYRPTQVTPSYTSFTPLSRHIYRPTQVTPSYTLFTFLFVLRHLSLLRASSPLARSCTLPAPIRRAPRFTRSSIPSLLTFTTFTTLHDFSRLFTTLYDFARLLLCPGRRKGLHPFAHCGLRAAPYPAYSMITAFSLPPDAERACPHSRILRTCSSTRNLFHPVYFMVRLRLISSCLFMPLYVR